MKQYILSILCLLAALVQPATAQTSLSTKAAPAEPVMPYVVTITQPTSGDTANLLTATTDYPTTNTAVVSGAIAYEGKDVKFSITALPQGYITKYGYPKVYETNTPNTVINTTPTSEGWTFTMPAKPVTIEVKYNKVDDLDLSTLTENATLTFEGGKWAYRIGTEETLTPFTGTIKGSTTDTLTLVGSKGVLTLADGTSVASITATAVTLNVAKGGTATVNGLTSDSNSPLNVSPANAENGRLLVCTNTALSSNNIRGLMQWTWEKAPTSPVAVYTPWEEPLITFADTSKTSYATNISSTTSVKVQVGDKWQQGTSTENVSTFKMSDNGDLASFTGMAISRPATSITGSDTIFIVNENTYTQGTISTTKGSFSGTITGDVSVINVTATVKGYPIIILENVKPKNYLVGDTLRVENGAEVTLGIKGSENLINAITILPGGAVNVDTVPSGGSLTIAPKIINDGKFWCKTSIISEVVGKASLKIISTSQDTVITAGGTYNLNVGANSDTSDANVTYQWQSYDLASKMWNNISKSTSTSLLRAEPTTGPTCATYTTNALGTYRCVVTSTSKDNAAVTTLTTRTAKVTQKSDPGPGPTPTPTFYTVTLPTLTGANSDPIAGVHQVMEWSDFAFGLTLDKDYNQSKVIVSTNRDGKIQANSDGKYTISRIDRDIIVSIEGIVKNSTVGNAVIDSDRNRIWTDGNLLCIHTDAPQVWVYTFNGVLATTLSTSEGQCQTHLPAGAYIVRIAGKSYKVAISNQ